MEKQKKTIRIVIWSLVGVLLAAAVLYFTPWLTTYEIKFTCYVTKDGVLQEKAMEVPTEVVLVDYLFQEDRVFVNTMLPEDFEWEFVPHDDTLIPGIVDSLKHYNLPYFASYAAYFHGGQNALTSGIYAISWESGYLYISIHGQSGSATISPEYHIFGSVDPEQTPEQIRHYFADFSRIFLSDK